ncbi:MAG: aspartate/glutamate racemase family protein [Myxococcota bacterium]
MRLGVIDWGIGGMGLVAALGPDRDVTYLSDAGVTPYGLMEADALSARLSDLCGFLVSEGVERVALACNAASSVLAQVRAPVPVDGVLVAGITASLRESGTIGVIGGRQTIRSDVYGRALRTAGRRVVQRVAQPLSALVERGVVSGPTVEDAVVEIFDALGSVDVLLMGCTHYPALSSIFSRLRPGWVLVDPVAELAGALRPVVGPGRLRTFTSGDPGATRFSAFNAWGVDSGEVVRFRLPPASRSSGRPGSTVRRSGR